MATLSEKLQLTLATKKNIKREIENRGVYVGDAPFSEYPSKIASIGALSDWKEPDWADVQQIRLLDTENYTFKSIYLLDDSTDTIFLEGGEAYKTSDSDTLITQDGRYVFTGDGDVECSKGYNTRWVMVYRNQLGNSHPDGMGYSLLYVIMDGADTLSGLNNSVKLRYVDCLCPVTSIGGSAFKDCCNLVYVSGLKNVSSIGDAAFKNCINLTGIDSTGGYSLGTEAFSKCKSLKDLILRNVTISNSNAFTDSKIERLFWGSSSDTVNFYDVGKIVFEDGCSYIDANSDGCKIEVENAPSIISSRSAGSTNRVLYKEVEDLISTSDSSLYITLPSIKKLSLPNLSQHQANLLVGSNCENLEELEMPIATVASVTSSPKLIKLYAPLISTGRIHSLKSLESISFPNYVEIPSIEGSFHNLEKCRSIELPALTKAEASCVHNNKNLESVYFPSLVSMGASTASSSFSSFYDLPKCTSINLPKLVSSSQSMFYNLPLMETINLPKLEGVTPAVLYNLGKCASISLPAFTGTLRGVYNCPELLTLDLPLAKGVNGVYNCDKLETVNAPNITTVKDSIYNCPSLKTLNLPSVTSITYGDGLYNLGIESLELPSLTTISLASSSSSSSASMIFRNLPHLEEVHLPLLTTVGYPTSSRSPFRGCTSLKVFDAPLLTNLYSYFLAETGIEEYTVGSNVTSHSSPFYGAPYLRRLIFADGYNGSNSTAVFAYVAQNCPMLEYIYIPASITKADSTNTSANYHIAAGCPNLTTIELGQGYSKTLYLKHITTLTKECVVNMLNALADLSGGTKQTLYIYSGTLALLSDEEKAIATNKNWTLAS